MAIKRISKSAYERSINKAIKNAFPQASINARKELRNILNRKLKVIENGKVKYKDNAINELVKVVNNKSLLKKNAFLKHELGDIKTLKELDKSFDLDISKQQELRKIGNENFKQLTREQKALVKRFQNLSKELSGLSKEQQEQLLYNAKINVFSRNITLAKLLNLTSENDYDYIDYLDWEDLTDRANINKIMKNLRYLIRENIKQGFDKIYDYNDAFYANAPELFEYVPYDYDNLKKEELNLTSLGVRMEYRQDYSNGILVENVNVDWNKINFIEKNAKSLSLNVLEKFIRDIENYNSFINSFNNVAFTDGSDVDIKHLNDKLANINRAINSRRISNKNILKLRGSNV